MTCDDLYAFLTTGANKEVKALHPKAMPVILRTPDEVEEWFTLPVEKIKAYQKSKTLPDGSLQIVGRGRKKDGPGMPFETVKAEDAPKEEPPAQASLF